MTFGGATNIQSTTGRKLDSLPYGINVIRIQPWLGKMFDDLSFAI